MGFRAHDFGLRATFAVAGWLLAVSFFAGEPARAQTPAPVTCASQDEGCIEYSPTTPMDFLGKFWTPDVANGDLHSFKKKLKDTENHAFGQLQQFNALLTQEVDRTALVQCYKYIEEVRRVGPFQNCLSSVRGLSGNWKAINAAMGMREEIARRMLLSNTIRKTPWLQEAQKKDPDLSQEPTGNILGVYDKLLTAIRKPAASPAAPVAPPPADQQLCRREESGSLEANLSSCLKQCRNVHMVQSVGARCDQLKNLGLEALGNEKLLKTMAFMDGEELISLTRFKAVAKFRDAYYQETGKELDAGDIPQSCKKGDYAGYYQTLLKEKQRPAGAGVLATSENQRKFATQAKRLLDFDTIRKAQCKKAEDSKFCEHDEGKRSCVILDKDAEKTCDELDAEINRSLAANPTLAPKGFPEAQDRLRLARKIVEAPAEQTGVLKNEEHEKITGALSDICGASWKELLRHPIGAAAAKEVAVQVSPNSWSLECLDKQKNFPKEMWKDLPSACLAATGLAVMVPPAGFVITGACLAGGLYSRFDRIADSRKSQQTLISCGEVNPEVCNGKAFQELAGQIDEEVRGIYMDVAMAAAPAAAGKVAKAVLGPLLKSGLRVAGPTAQKLLARLKAFKSALDARKLAQIDAEANSLIAEFDAAAANAGKLGSRESSVLAAVEGGGGPPGVELPSGGGIPPGGRPTQAWGNHPAQQGNPQVRANPTQLGLPQQEPPAALANTDVVNPVGYAKTDVVAPGALDKTHLPSKTPTKIGVGNAGPPAPKKTIPGVGEPPNVDATDLGQGAAAGAPGARPLVRVATPPAPITRPALPPGSTMDIPGVTYHPPIRSADEAAAAIAGGSKKIQWLDAGATQTVYAVHGEDKVAKVFDPEVIWKARTEHWAPSLKKQAQEDLAKLGRTYPADIDESIAKLIQRQRALAPDLEKKVATLNLRQTGAAAGEAGQIKTSMVKGLGNVNDMGASLVEKLPPTISGEVTASSSGWVDASKLLNDPNVKIPAKLRNELDRVGQDLVGQMKPFNDKWKTINIELHQPLVKGDFIGTDIGVAANPLTNAYVRIENGVVKEIKFYDI